MRFLVTTCLLASALAPIPAAAQAQLSDLLPYHNAKADTETQNGTDKCTPETLKPGERCPIGFLHRIGRVVVDHEGVIDVAAASPTSLMVQGVAPGETTLSVYSTRGQQMAQIAVKVAASIVAPKGEQVVAVDVQFAAVSANTLKALGFNFSALGGSNIIGAVAAPTTLSGFNLANGGSSTSVGAPLQSAFNLFLSSQKQGIGGVISALSSNGLSQLLAQPTLLTRSGEPASFLAGGEIPVPVPQSSGGTTSTITIQYKEFGVRLSVTPYVLSPDRIVLKIAPEVSELDYGIGIQLQGYTVPGLRRRSAETTVELGTGQSFVIAGLSYSNTALTKEKMPLLGDIPVLGAFFRRQQNQREQQELIIVATPRLVGPVSAAALPPLPGSATAQIDPSVGQMAAGTDGIDQRTTPFGVVRN